VETYSQDPWTEAQWTQVQEAVRDEAKKQRVAASFLPLYGPLAPDTQTVPLQVLTSRPRGVAAGNFLQVDDFTTRRLTTLSVSVGLRSAQVAEPDLSSALLAFRRAANLIARAEDQLVLNGQAGANAPLPAGLDPCTVTGGEMFDGLLTVAIANGQTVPVGPAVTGPDLVTAIEDAAGMLESNGHLGPFALVLNTRLFTIAHDPLAASLVLPADRIKPLLDGPLLRSSTLNLGGRGPRGRLPMLRAPKGIMVSLADDLVDLVVASDICVRLIQVTAEASPRHVYRVSERFTLRIKQETAVVELG
jgi:uncharacterized linocin/CFP29 family protein